MRVLLFSMALLLLTVSHIRADGPPHDNNNRYAGGEVIILTLTKRQIQFLESPGWNPDILLRLTAKQTGIIKKAWGVAPSTLEVWETRKGWWNCSCMSANLGLRFAIDKVEVPKAYVMSDKEAAKTRNAE
jgi:hypothetical protein